MALSPNSAQSRELTELRNHLKWLDEERRKAARKLGEMEQRIAQQGRDITEREKRIHELEWQLAQISERVEQLPESSNGPSGQEQRLQDLEWHMSNINAQLVRLPKLDEELNRFREDLAQSSVDIENRLMAQQAGTSEQLENNVYTRLREEITASVVDYDNRLAAAQNELLGRLAVTEATVGEQMDGQMATREELNRIREDLVQSSLDIENRLITQQAGTTEQLQNDVYTRLREDITASVVDYDNRLAAAQNELLGRLAVSESTLADRLAVTESTLANQLAVTQSTWADRLAATESTWADRLAVSESTLTDRLSATESTLTDRLTSAETTLSEQLNRQIAAQVEGLTEPVVARLVALEAAGTMPAGYEESLAEMQAAISRHDAALVGLTADDGSASVLAQLEQELELRQSEELRLANLIGVQDNKVERNIALIEEMNRVIAQMQGQAADYEERISALGDNFHELDETWKPVLMEASGKIMPINDRLNTLANSVTKAEANLQTLAADQSEIRTSLTAVSDATRQTRTELTAQMDGWQATIDEHKETVERFTQQWLTLSSQYKEARMAVQNFAHWQKQLEQQKREASEMLRVESNRMQSRWEGFLLEIQEQLKNVDLDLAQKWQAFEMENEQRWVASRRNEQLWREEMANVDDLIVKLQQDSRNLIWRVQAAQADAIKKWPRLLLEEVEKAVELNPNRRLQPTTGATAAARADMSVADAIEQGLIKVDYDDDITSADSH